MKKYFYFICMVFMSIATVTLSSCGNDDDTTSGNTDADKTEMIAVHKIKIAVTGNPGTFKWSATFNGLTYHNHKAEPAVIYDDKGNTVEGRVSNFNTITVETNQYGTALAAAILVTDYDMDKAGDLTFRLEGYVDGKLRNSKTYTVKGGEISSFPIGFTSISLD